MSADKKKNAMNAADLKKFKEMLLERRKKLVGDVAQLETEAQRSADDVSVDHMADHGSDSYELDQTIGLIERESKALREIDAALKRMADGDYGTCDDCEKKIPKVRLRAMPSARLCLDCQMLAERS